MRRILYLLAHMAAGWICLRLSFLIRFDFLPTPTDYVATLHEALPWAVLIKGLAAEALGLTRRIWRFAAFSEIRPVFTASVLGSVVMVAVSYGFIDHAFPRGPLLLDFLLTLGVFASLRFSGRVWDRLMSRLQGVRGRVPELAVLGLGAGRRGETALRMLGQSPAQRIRVVGILDDNPVLKGALLQGVPVLGSLGDLPEILRARPVDEVLMALEEPSPEQIREVFRVATAAACSVRILAPDYSTKRLDVHENPIRRLNLSDLLGRPPVRLDPAPLRQELAGKRVLVTGAGGSIGSELCRQIAEFPVAKLILLDLAENALFEIAEEMEARPESPSFVIALCDIRRVEDLNRVFADHRPEVVFHAAACKHVGMMEIHPSEAVNTNVLGTQNVLRAARMFHTERFLHVSTDKAVNPVGIMGASKAWSERVVLRAAAEAKGLCCSCVRFGNVLGSNGSVIPLFERQLRRNGELRVTHEEATRYFMTLEEAVLLMLHAESLRQSGSVFVLDMGQPVRILDMAEQIQDLTEVETGSRPSVKMIGLRPGEKLHETLVSEQQTLEPTDIPKVQRVLGLVPVDGNVLEEGLRRLEEAAARRDDATVRTLLK